MRSILEKVSALLVLASLLGCSQQSKLPEPIKGSGAEDPKRGGILNVATFGDIRAADPANISDGLAPQVNEAIYAGLVDYDSKSNVVPDIAERWVIEDEGKTFRFFMREGVRFHDGEEVTADDVKRSTERALHPSAPNPNTGYYTSILGYDDFVAKKKNDLEGVVVEGKYVVTYRLKEPDATFLRVLALQVLRPVCKSAGNRYTDSFHPCGAGPFKLEANGWERGRQLTLVRHDGYFKPGLPYLDGLRWLFHANQTSQRFRFIQGDLDILRDFLMPDLLRFQADDRWRPYGVFDADRQILGDSMNVEMPPFDNVEIRRAVACAVDRKQMELVRAANMRAANQLVPPGVFGYEKDLAGQKYDLAEALEHMRRAGYPYDPVTKTGGWPHVIPYLVYKTGLQEYTSQVLAQQLEKIGIRIEIRVVNYPTFMALRGRRKTSAIGPYFWQQDYPDAMSFLEPLFHSKSIADEDSTNTSFYKNPRFDELVDRAHKELDDARRKKIYDEAQGILIDDAPWAFTAYYRWYVQKQPYVRDYEPHPMWTHEAKSAWLDRVAGPIGARAIFRRDQLGARAPTTRSGVR